MVSSTRITVVLIAACLSGCGGLSMLEETDSTASLERPSKLVERARSAEVPPAPLAEAPAAKAATGATAAPSNAAASPSLFTRATVEASPMPPVAVSAPTAAEPAAAARPAAPLAAETLPTEPRGRAYLFRGMAGLFYSRGMDSLAARINGAGVGAVVNTYLMWRPVADQAIRDYRRDPAPVVLIGHSAGGDSALAFAELLNAAQIPVSLLVTYDPTRVADNVPPNVERYINIYQSSSIMGGGDVVPGGGFHGHYASVNLADHNEIVHINIEKADRIQEQLVRKIAQLAATPAAGETEAVPIRYVVPARASIELWDSGVPITAPAGATLQTLSGTYHVPVWALAQINGISQHAAIKDGQRVVVPRHLMPTVLPASPVSAYAATPR